VKLHVKNIRNSCTFEKSQRVICSITQFKYLLYAVFTIRENRFCYCTQCHHRHDTLLDLLDSLTKLRAVKKPSLLVYQPAVGSTSISVSPTCFPHNNTCSSEVFKLIICSSKCVRKQHHEQDSNTLTYSWRGSKFVSTFRNCFCRSRSSMSTVQTHSGGQAQQCQRNSQNAIPLFQYHTVNGFTRRSLITRWIKFHSHFYVQGFECFKGKWN
jgi:hypothetical protein